MEKDDFRKGRWYKNLSANRDYIVNLTILMEVVQKVFFIMKVNGQRL